MTSETERIAGHDEHREGFAHDLPQMKQRGMVGRRRLFGLVGGGVAAAALVACGSDGSDSSGASPSAPTGPPSGGPGGGPGGPPPGGAPGGMGGTSQDGLEEGDIPEETNGPYPADGSNGVNVLTESGIVRSDITRSFGAASGAVAGVPLTVRLKVYDHVGTEMTPYAGAAIYIWHCDAEGNYSLYSSGFESENWLRGVQEVGADGTVEFTSIFPGCYPGRWPHIHFEVYPSLTEATNVANKLRTSQIAFPQDVCESVYRDKRYGSSSSNLASLSLSSDNVFADGHSLQMATMDGSVEGGYALELAVPV